MGLPTVNGVIADIGDGLVRVLLGEAEEEWYFPLTTMPDGVRVGDDVLFVQQDGSYAALSVQRVAARTVERSIEDRLNRRMAVRRTTEQLRAADVRAALDPV